jgi:hypothetical protein
MGPDENIWTEDEKIIGGWIKLHEDELYNLCF